MSKDMAMTAQAIQNGPMTDNQQFKDPRPEEVQKLAKNTADAADMYRLVKDSHFPALGAPVVSMLLDFLSDNYKKQYNELCVHPWVIEQQRLAEEAENAK